MSIEQAGEDTCRALTSWEEERDRYIISKNVNAFFDPFLHVLCSVFRQLNTSMAVSQMSAVQCRLAPLIQVIQDCSHLYHYTVKLMFKLHSCK